MYPLIGSKPISKLPVRIVTGGKINGEDLFPIVQGGIWNEALQTYEGGETRWARISEIPDLLGGGGSVTLDETLYIWDLTRTQDIDKKIFNSFPALNTALAADSSIKKIRIFSDLTFPNAVYNYPGLTFIEGARQGNLSSFAQGLTPARKVMLQGNAQLLNVMGMSNLELQSDRVNNTGAIAALRYTIPKAYIVFAEGFYTAIQPTDKRNLFQFDVVEATLEGNGSLAFEPSIILKNDLDSFTFQLRSLNGNFFFGFTADLQGVDPTSLELKYDSTTDFHSDSSGFKNDIDTSGFDTISYTALSYSAAIAVQNIDHRRLDGIPDAPNVDAMLVALYDYISKNIQRFETFAAYNTYFGFSDQAPLKVPAQIISISNDEIFAARKLPDNTGVHPVTISSVLLSTSGRGIVNYDPETESEAAVYAYPITVPGIVGSVIAGSEIYILTTDGRLMIFNTGTKEFDDTIHDVKRDTGEFPTRIDIDTHVILYQYGYFSLFRTDTKVVTNYISTFSFDVNADQVFYFAANNIILVNASNNESAEARKFSLTGAVLAQTGTATIGSTDNAIKRENFAKDGTNLYVIGDASSFLLNTTTMGVTNYTFSGKMGTFSAGKLYLANYSNLSPLHTNGFTILTLAGMSHISVNMSEAVVNLYLNGTRLYVATATKFYIYDTISQAFLYNEDISAIPGRKFQYVNARLFIGSAYLKSFLQSVYVHTPALTLQRIYPQSGSGGGGGSTYDDTAIKNRLTALEAGGGSSESNAVLIDISELTGISVGMAVRYNGSNSRANSFINASAIGVIESIDENDIARVVTHGKITLTDLIPGATYYVPLDADALPTITAPSTPGDWVTRLFIAESETEAFVDISDPFVIVESGSAALDFQFDASQDFNLGHTGITKAIVFKNRQLYPANGGANWTISGSTLTIVPALSLTGDTGSTPDKISIDFDYAS